ncbi:hypothetical protein DERF_003791 [Dermatophagoides farinae]|uniref:Uncharacterized protein n=1 Tax=Dermatophagoides farinae TaxID=6954 RepID=A0A922IEW1_DERFA|nr:hypothetical protein DERF_003791 [Dermatophagoides farinae]
MTTKHCVRRELLLVQFLPLRPTTLLSFKCTTTAENILPAKLNAVSSYILLNIAISLQ